MDVITSKPNWIFHDFLEPLLSFQTDSPQTMTRVTYEKSGVLHNVEFNPYYELVPGKVYAIRDCGDDVRIYEILPLPVDPHDGQWGWGAEAKRT